MNNDDLLKIILADDADQIIKLLVAKNTADEADEDERAEDGQRKRARVSYITQGRRQPNE